MTRTNVLLLGALLLAGCRCNSNVKQVRPALWVTPVTAEFGPVKVDTTATMDITLTAQTAALVNVSSVTLEADPTAAGVEAFSLDGVPAEVPALSSQIVTLSFRPTALVAYGATLVVRSDDPELPEIRVSVRGKGATPVLTVTPECDVAKKCTGTVVVSPPAIDFGAEPFARLLEPDPTTLPQLVVHNGGEVELLVTRLAIQGADAAAFSFVGNSTLPAGGLPVAAGTGVSLALRFKPTSEQQSSYTAEVVVEGDDKSHPQVKVALAGTLRANLPPVVCANIVRVVPGDGSAPIDYSTKSDWSSLLNPPPAGYDFASIRDIQPRSQVLLSAISDSADQTKCTFDPEDGRIALTYDWQLTSAPAGAAPPALVTNPPGQARLQPYGTGVYEMSLTVRDTQGHATTVPIRFAVVLKQDLVVQLSWSGYSNVDLDVHLIRPSAVATADPFSGAFDFFSHLPGGTSGDINGYSVIKQQNTSGFDFDWGEAGTPDDPKLNFDDTGSGQLVENVSLNYPENDARCGTAPCGYKVMVHYFAERRSATGAASCTIDGASCHEGDSCDCAQGLRCVANAASADAGAVGAGRCFDAPRPMVRIFVRGNPTPAAVIPLEGLSPPDLLAVPAPCQLLYVAEIRWPRKGTLDGGLLPDGGSASAPVIVVQGADPATGRITQPVFAHFGDRSTSGSLLCAPNVVQTGGVAWYERAF